MAYSTCTRSVTRYSIRHLVPGTKDCTCARTNFFGMAALLALHYVNQSFVGHHCCLVHTCFLVPDMNIVPGNRSYPMHTYPSTWYQVPGTMYQVPVPRYHWLHPSFCSLVSFLHPGTWYLVCWWQYLSIASSWSLQLVVVILLLLCHFWWCLPGWCSWLVSLLLALLLLFSFCSHFCLHFCFYFYFCCCSSLFLLLSSFLLLFLLLSNLLLSLLVMLPMLLYCCHCCCCYCWCHCCCRCCCCCYCCCSLGTAAIVAGAGVFSTATIVGTGGTAAVGFLVLLPNGGNATIVVVTVLWWLLCCHGHCWWHHCHCC